MIEHAIEVFNEYTNNFDKSVELIKIRYDHSISVMNLMGELAILLKLSEEDIELAKLIGLLHDIGRFDQIKKYNSCSDTKTGMDHALHGCDYLFKENHIRDFIEDNKYDDIINKAIYHHNKIRIDGNLNDKELLFSKMIRDMDKLDIYHEEGKYFTCSFNSDDLTSIVEEEFKSGKLIDMKNLKTPTDGTMLELGLIYDINFKESMDMFNKTKYFEEFINSVGVTPNSIDKWNEIKTICLNSLK